jgi:hypothetical protein
MLSSRLGQLDASLSDRLHDLLPYLCRHVSVASTWSNANRPASLEPMNRRSCRDAQNLRQVGGLAAELVKAP